MSLWQAGEFDKLVREARYIQECYASRRRSRTPEQVSKIFSKLMLEGKVNAAMRLLDETNSGDVPSLSNEVLEELLKKHPASQPADESTLIRGEVPFVDPAVFANIDEASVVRAAMYTKGAAGPFGLDALGWGGIFLFRRTMAIQGRSYENLLHLWHEIWQHVHLRFKRMGQIVLKHICHAD